MEIRLLQMPFRFTTPDGPMEITVRSDTVRGQPAGRKPFAGAAIFIQHGPRALERIQVTPSMGTHGEAMKALLTGFAVNPDAHDKDSQSYRVLTALCKAHGVEQLDN